jgi:hypothetical protein
VVAAENTCFLADHQLGRFWELIQRLIVDRAFRQITARAYDSRIWHFAKSFSICANLRGYP